MRPLPILALGLAALASCSGDPCNDVRTPDQALASSCGAANDHAMMNTVTPPCTPSRGTICTIIGTGIAGVGTNNVLGTASATYLPQDTTYGPDGRLYFLDWNNHVIRVQGSDGKVTTVVGNGELTDGTPDPVMPGAPRQVLPALQVRLNHPTQISFDVQGRMLIAAWHNSMIKRVFTDSNRALMVEDLCGTGARSFAGDGGPALASALNLPVAVVVTPAGDTLIADQANQRIRRVAGDGTISTLVGDGMPGYRGDNGPAAMAELRNPVGQAASPAGRIDVDAQGNIFIADTGNNAVRRVDHVTGNITTVAGNGTAGATGDGGPATAALLNQPTDVEVGPDGTLYIADSANSCVRSVTADGVMHTVAGRCGMRGFQGDGASPTLALLDRPGGVETDTAGRLYIADTYNHRIRVVTLR